MLKIVTEAYVNPC